MPASLSEKLTAMLAIPTIGIGSGPGCDGQVLLAHDILGLIPGFSPRHAKKYADLSPIIAEAFKSYAQDVGQGRFPGPEHCAP